MICKTCKLDKSHSHFAYWPSDESKGSTCKACTADKNKRIWVEKREALNASGKQVRAYIRKESS